MKGKKKDTPPAGPSGPAGLRRPNGPAQPANPTPLLIPPRNPSRHPTRPLPPTLSSHVPLSPSSGSRRGEPDPASPASPVTTPPRRTPPRLTPSRPGARPRAALDLELGLGPDATTAWSPPRRNHVATPDRSAAARSSTRLLPVAQSSPTPPRPPLPRTLLPAVSTAPPSSLSPPRYPARAPAGIWPAPSSAPAGAGDQSGCACTVAMVASPHCTARRHPRPA